MVVNTHIRTNAYGATCNYYHKKNHFIAVGRKRERAQVHEIVQMQNKESVCPTTGETLFIRFANQKNITIVFQILSCLCKPDSTASSPLMSV